MIKKQLLIILLIILFTIICPYLVYAREIELNTNNSKVKSGDEVIISIKIKDVSIEEGINSLQGQLVYDKNDWEPVKTEDIKSKNNWSITYNDEETEAEGKFILINFGLGETEEQELVEIRLKSKAKIIGNNSKIKLTDLYTTDGENMIKIEDQSTKVNIQGNITALLIITLASLTILGAIVIFIIKIKRK